MAKFNRKMLSEFLAPPPGWEWDIIENEPALIPVDMRCFISVVRGCDHCSERSEDFRIRRTAWVAEGNPHKDREDSDKWFVYLPNKDDVVDDHVYFDTWQKAATYIHTRVLLGEYEVV
jgi:hypothetical protein